MSPPQSMRRSIQAASRAIQYSSAQGGGGLASTVSKSAASPGQRRAFSTSSSHGARPSPKRPARANPRVTPSNNNSDNRQSLSELLTQRKTPLIAMGLAAMVIGGYVAMLVMSAAGDPHDHDDEESDCCMAIPTGRPRDVRQGRITALVFDQELNASEGRMGIKGLRKLMGGLARGHVLEVAVGTGRNVDFVDWDEIRAAAPPVVVEGDGNKEARREVKSEKELEKDRVARRIAKGQKGMVLPGDEEPEVVSYTGVDVSTDVLEVTWGKLRKVVPELIPRRRRSKSPEAQQEAEQHEQPHAERAATRTSSATAVVANPQPNGPDEVLAANIGAGRIRLYKSDAQVRLPPPPALTSHDSTRVHPAAPFYDTVLQNFGLCSVADPQRLLANMAAVLRPGSGRIYLLEHGRGSYGWLNSLLDKFAPGHFRKYGCWWNRDIEEIVRRAEREVPGLEVVGVTRPLWMQGGTMLWIELRVNPDKLVARAASVQASKTR